ncbi:MAG TPA: acyl-CoA dehydrogenase family protein [Terriglobia bacterium]|nr:acyl-CoA dehydrogenase family protein [Terriglobia bacterium]
MVTLAPSPTAPSPSTAPLAARLLADIRQLAPGISARAAEIESARRIPPDLVERLRSIGVFRMFTPQRLGGLELELPAALEVIRTLGRIDGSLGWAAMIGSGSALFASLLPRETYEAIYRHGPDAIVAGAAVAAGKAEATENGWRVSGRWPFASGCQHADWIFGLCVMTAEGKPLPGHLASPLVNPLANSLSGPGKADATRTEGPHTEGPPVIKGVFLPARDWRIEDTWQAAGLKGTGSHHVALHDKLVPTAHFFDAETDIPCEPGPLYQAVLHLLPFLIGAINVGMAEGALDEIVALANTGRQQVRVPVAMRQSEIFQSEIGRIAAELQAARALLQVQADNHWRHALDRTLKTEALLIQGRQAAAWIAATCVRIADACFMLGGGAALYESSPLQRRLRDLHAAQQHAIVHPRHYVSAGKILLDIPLAG